MYQPCYLLPCCQGKLGELTKKTVYETYGTVHFVTQYFPKASLDLIGMNLTQVGAVTGGVAGGVAGAATGTAILTPAPVIGGVVGGCAGAGAGFKAGKEGAGFFCDMVQEAKHSL